MPDINQGFKGKIGTFAFITLILGSFAIVGSISLLLFLWIGDVNNTVWRWLVVHNYMHTAANVLAQILAWAISSQLVLMTSMLVSFMLERSYFTFETAAEMSLARSCAQTSTIFCLLWRQIRRKSPAMKLVSVPSPLIMIFATNFVFSFFLPPVLMNDFGLATVPGGLDNFAQAVDFKYDDGLSWVAPPGYPLLLHPQTVWNSKPVVYPTFGEYAEPPYIAQGVSDTGLNLKALLPFQVQNTRETIQSYDGETIVVDSRVTSQYPILNPVEARLSGNNLLLRGFISPSQNTPRLYPAMVPVSDEDKENIQKFNESIAFNCSVGINDLFLDPGSEQWKISMCQLPHKLDPVRGMVSEFQSYSGIANASHQDSTFSWNDFGPTYIVLNITKGNFMMWDQGLNPHPDKERWFTPEDYQVRDEWHDLFWAKGDLVLSISLSYVSFMTARVPVTMTSQYNRTEPYPVYNFTRQIYDFGAIRAMLGQDSHMSSSERGILDLEKKKSWIAEAEELPPPNLGPFTRRFAGGIGTNITGSWTINLWNCSDSTALHSNIEVNNMLVDMFQEILQTGGSVAFAIQAILTTMTQMSYYDNLEVFDLKESVKVSKFIVVNVPRGWRGLLTVLVMTTLHAFSLLFVFIMHRRTKYSTIGAGAWHVIAQLESRATHDFLDAASFEDDDTVNENLIGESRRHNPVTIAYNFALQRPELVELDSSQPRRSTQRDARSKLSLRIRKRRRARHVEL